jgi:hypothetical protein
VLLNYIKTYLHTYILHGSISTSILWSCVKSKPEYSWLAKSGARGWEVALGGREQADLSITRTDATRRGSGELRNTPLQPRWTRRAFVESPLEARRPMDERDEPRVTSSRARHAVPVPSSVATPSQSLAGERADRPGETREGEW